MVDFNRDHSLSGDISLAAAWEEASRVKEEGEGVRRRGRIGRISIRSPFSILIRHRPLLTNSIQEVKARQRLEQQKRWSPSLPRLQLYLLLCHVLGRRRLPFIAFFTECWKCLQRSMFSLPSSLNVADEKRRW
ncbi:hypothetical protein BHM03_00015971 [Ensete ventricosum]|nr:hypothetical protein BHM03_00015971 [Ensete ventricosum]